MRPYRPPLHVDLPDANCSDDDRWAVLERAAARLGLDPVAVVDTHEVIWRKPHRIPGWMYTDPTPSSCVASGHRREPPDFDINAAFGS